MGKYLSGLPWYGGKLKMLDRLYELLPPSDSGLTTFIDVFGGGASVSINLPGDHWQKQIYNDIDGDVCAFFRVLRDQPEEFLRLLKLTPTSREEFELAKRRERHLTDLERGRRMFVLARQSWGGIIDSGKCAFSVNNTNCSTAANSVDRVLPLVAERLRRIAIESMPAIKLIERYDSPETLFYLDPPYLKSTRTVDVVGTVRAYEYEMTDSDHVALLTKIKRLDGQCMLSGYRSDLYDEMLSDWHCNQHSTFSTVSASRGGDRTILREERIWTSYEPPASGPRII